ncbi:hypothetical protein HWB57_gp036 [Erwinia phage vB_EamM-Bue1]|uniref:Uncharacterized protein n=1 Tax=Erwinia phage vB_EamM-Bue1 TaxID=2099338 RepID=A0A2U9PFF7_9CAUD|nr:hypothetical protein HWB57_gp036 [Erwinia phage vB_EamM-Bue1]AWT50343.1 hypothetical protein [Erwinia phage vB_EamM-Bue1]
MLKWLSSLFTPTRPRAVWCDPAVSILTPFIEERNPLLRERLTAALTTDNSLGHTWVSEYHNKPVCLSTSYYVHHYKDNPAETIKEAIRFFHLFMGVLEFIPMVKHHVSAKSESSYLTVTLEMAPSFTIRDKEVNLNVRFILFNCPQLSECQSFIDALNNVAEEYIQRPNAVKVKGIIEQARKELDDQEQDQRKRENEARRSEELRRIFAVPEENPFYSRELMSWVERNPETGQFSRITEEEYLQRSRT